MNTPYVRAPHQEGSPVQGHTAPNAALLIDFDNVTMGMRSDLSKELKTLLNSDIIKGKVAVQRAYADWRRYPQYIVPLSEASIDLIFAPAYGSNKKNATDIRMAIDGMELVFTRPEIGVFILLTGDSDFSSLVLKLKEYGKYVIGVGIQESSSDILVQNCDEYYSYTSLAGLRKTTDADTEAVDPWLLVEKALSRMQSRNDVMRSDRLKQVMLEIDSGFDESEYGFSKFSRFLTEAASRDLVDLKRMDNGQYEVRPTKGGSGRGGSGDGGRGGGRAESSRSGDGRGRKESKGAAAPEAVPSAGGRTRGRATRARTRPGRDRSGSTEREEQKERTPSGGREKAAAESARDQKRDQKEKGDPLQEAYDLLTSAVERLTRERDIPAVRDSDVKRKMLEADRSFDEAELGFSKFSLFLQQADEHDVIVLRKRESGNYEVGLPGAAAEAAEAGTADDGGPSEEAGTTGAEEQAREGRREEEEAEGPAAEDEQEDEHETAAGDKEQERRSVQEILDRHRVSTRSEPAATRAGAEEAAKEVESEQVRAEPEGAEESEGTEEEAAEAEKAASGGAKAPTSRGRGLGPRRGERPGRRGRKEDSGPPILPGQMVQKGSSGTSGSSTPSDEGHGSGEAVGSSHPEGRRGGGTGAGSAVDVVPPEELGLPTDEESVIRYLTNSYKGVGEKTAETLVDELGGELFSVLQRQPDRIREVLPANRADQLLDAWREDLSRRKDTDQAGE